MEEWKMIPEYEGLYKASTLGRIFSFDRRIPSKAGSTMIRKAKYLVLPCRTNGYAAITLVDINGVRKQKLIHRLIAELFIPNPDNKPQVNHKNGNKTDNRVENLEWVTQNENMSHAFRTGLHRIPDNTGRFNQGSSCRVAQYDLNGKFIKEWPSIKEACRHNKFCESSISLVCKGKQNTHLGYRWKYITNPRLGMGNYKITNPRIDAEIGKLG
jgi:hypothetical protein